MHFWQLLTVLCMQLQLEDLQRELQAFYPEPNLSCFSSQLPALLEHYISILQVACHVSRYQVILAHSGSTHNCSWSHSLFNSRQCKLHAVSCMQALEHACRASNSPWGQECSLQLVH